MVRMELLAHICQFCCTVTSRDSLTSLDTAQDQVRGSSSPASVSSIVPFSVCPDILL